MNSQRLQPGDLFVIDDSSEYLSHQLRLVIAKTPWKIYIYHSGKQTNVIKEYDIELYDSSHIITLNRL